MTEFLNPVQRCGVAYNEGTRSTGVETKDYRLYCRSIVVGAFLAAMLLAGCGEEASRHEEGNSPSLIRLFPTADSSAPRFSWISASALWVRSQGDQYFLMVASNGLIAGIDPGTGRQSWKVQLPAPEGLSQSVRATPAQFDNKVAVAQQIQDGDLRIAHRVLVVDLDRREVDPDFPAIELHATKRDVDGKIVRFNPPTSLSRSSLVYGEHSGSGYLYVSFGNGRDIQPWHGWVFEIDLTAWKSRGADSAISGVLLTTPESHCPTEGQSGNRDNICGGGIWTHSGPQLYPSNGSYELLIPTGNGQFDLAREDYAQTLMRVYRGLDFDPECDPRLCEPFLPENPDLSCIESCVNLFVPRPLPGDPNLNPGSGACAGKTFWQCLNAMDWDLGANAPIKMDLEGELAVYVLPGKDGGVYLIDAKHMGKMYDRMQITESCDTPYPRCHLDWAGTIATQPTATTVDGVPLVLIPTYMPSPEQPAGVVALKVLVGKDGPYFERYWEAPDFSTEESKVRFMYHPSRVTISSYAGQKYAWVAEGRTLLGIRVRDGEIVERQELLEDVAHDVLPIIRNSVLYVPTRKYLEAYEIK